MFISDEHDSIAVNEVTQKKKKERWKEKKRGGVEHYFLSLALVYKAVRYYFKMSAIGMLTDIKSQFVFFFFKYLQICKKEKTKNLELQILVTQTKFPWQLVKFELDLNNFLIFENMK